MEIRISFDYREVTPASNGKRHSVTTYTDGLLISSIPEVSSQEAPAALIKTVQGERIEYRHFGGRLWTPDDSITAQAEISTSAPKSSLEILFSRQFRRSGGRNECISQMNELISNLIAIDGRMHIKADEPFYHVMTFGLGGNHGSTALVVGSTPHDGHSRFNIQDYPAAKQLADMVSSNRRDRVAVSLPEETFEVIIPEALTIPRRPYLSKSFSPTDRAGLKVIRGEFAYRMHYSDELEAYYQARAEDMKRELLSQGWSPDEDESFTHPSKPGVLISVDAGTSGDENCLVVQEPSSVPNEFRTIAEIFDLTDAAPADLVAAAIAVC